MITIIVTATLLGLAAWLFKEFWNEIIEFFEACIDAIIGINSIMTFIKRGTRVVAKIYTRLFNGKVQINQPPSEVHIDDVPIEIRGALVQEREVIVHERLHVNA